MTDSSSPSQLERANRFKALHERAGAFVIPNPWDLGSTRILSGLGFEALATTSAGFANSMGRLDGKVTLADVLEHCKSICSATPLPVTADLENCFADDPKQAAQTIVRAAQAGLVGGSIEDYGGEATGIYEFNLAVERVHAAVEAANSSPFPFLLTARAENLLRGVNDLDDTIRRLQAFEKVGAHVLYPPGMTTLDQVRTVTSSVTKPVNVLGPMVRGASVTELAQAGAKRISVGGALASVAMNALVRAAKELQSPGSFGWLAELKHGADIKRLLG